MKLFVLEDCLNGGETKRCHTLRTVHEESVASHSFGVAWMCVYLTGGNPSTGLLLSALTHDLPEQFTGDVPADAKREIPGLKTLLSVHEDDWCRNRGLDYQHNINKSDTLVLRLADSCHLMWKCIYERSLGNQTFAPVWEKVNEYAQETLQLMNDPHAAEMLLQYLNTKWRIVNGSK